MKPTQSMVLTYLDVLDSELRGALHEIVDSRREVEVGTLVTLVTMAVAERMVGRGSPAIGAIRRDVERLFDPSIFDDDKRTGPLAALAAIRTHIVATNG